MGFKILRKKIFFSGTKTQRKNISSYSEVVTKKVFTFGGWVGLIIFYISLFLINQLYNDSSEIKEDNYR
jgi:hypothetical protein